MSSITNDELIQIGVDWFRDQGWKPFPFQQKAWEKFLLGKNGLINAPTGMGKTYSLAIPAILEFIRDHSNGSQKENFGLQLIWISPIRALTKEIQTAIKRVVSDLDIPWNVSVRTGDTSDVERKMQKDMAPEVLITTPESIHLLLAQRHYPDYFSTLKAVVVDEWHELMGSKRAVQVELALSRFKTIAPSMKIWGISATIGNMDEALMVLLGSDYDRNNYEVVSDPSEKRITLESILPDTIEKFPWAGHLGIQMLEKVIPIIKASKTTLIFTNTRSFAEIWYQQLINRAPELIGLVAMHHGSIDREMREWVEENLHQEKLKAVVCTSSLDLGVDFRPVETIIQVGSAKGVARFIQRAGRSGHQPGAGSKIWFVPTHSLELVEAAALRYAMRHKKLESRVPYLRSFDVLIQYLVTLAVSEGFRPEEIWPEVKATFSYQTLTDDEWNWVLHFITTGGYALQAYNEYKRVDIKKGVYRIRNRHLSMKHRMSIGTIVGDIVMNVKYLSGQRLGTIEEWFINRLKPGDAFWFAGKTLELFKVQGMDVLVKKAGKVKGAVPSWMGGRMPLSSEMSEVLRFKYNRVWEKNNDTEIILLKPLFDLQEKRSRVPLSDEFLVEKLQSREGYHLFFYPFEGRAVHEGMAALFAHRISKVVPISLNLAMNDYGFEILSDQPIPIEKAIENGLFSDDELTGDIQESVNANEMAQRRFRDIAAIAGLIFKGYPGQQIKERHIQSSSSLLFKVYMDYEPENLLLKQAFEEAMTFQLEESRLRMALERIRKQQTIIKSMEKPSPFCFPIMVDRLNRDNISTEKIEDRVMKLKLELERD